MERLFLCLGALSACLAVAAGAYGAHGLEGQVRGLYPDDPERAARLLQSWDVAAHYQMYHALGLLAVAWACTRVPGRLILTAGCLFVAGTVLFSGSLYLLVLTGMRGLGAVTPAGGLAFMAGWLCLAAAAMRKPA